MNEKEKRAQAALIVQSILREFADKNVPGDVGVLALVETICASCVSIGMSEVLFDGLLKDAKGLFLEYRDFAEKI
jgi:hypothetical protein